MNKSLIIFFAVFCVLLIIDMVNKHDSDKMIKIKVTTDSTIMYIDGTLAK